MVRRRLPRLMVLPLPTSCILLADIAPDVGKYILEFAFSDILQSSRVGSKAAGNDYCDRAAHPR